MTSHRGYTNKGTKSGVTIVTHKNSKRLTPGGALILQAWQKLTDREKQVWHYNFQEYKKAKETI